MLLEYLKNTLNMFCSGGRLVGTVVHEGLVMSRGQAVSILSMPTPGLLESVSWRTPHLPWGKGK